MEVSNTRFPFNIKLFNELEVWFDNKSLIGDSNGKKLTNCNFKPVGENCPGATKIFHGATTVVSLNKFDAKCVRATTK